MEKTSTPLPDTVRALVDLWPTRAALAADIRSTKHRVDKWAQVNAIPAWFHAGLIRAAQARGFDCVTADLLVKLHDRAEAGPEGDELGEGGERVHAADPVTPVAAGEGNPVAGHTEGLRHV